MTTITSVRPANVMYTGEINVGSGQIGKFATLTTAATTIILSEYNNVYYCDDAGLPLARIRMPIIGNGSGQVRVGWRALFVLVSPVLATDTTINSNVFEFHDNSNSINLYTLNMLNYNFNSAANIFGTSYVTATALVAPSTWEFTSDAVLGTPSFPKPGILPYYNGSYMPLPTGSAGMIVATSLSDSVNVLIATPLIVRFNYALQRADERFMAYNTPSTTTAFVANVAGTFSIEAVLGFAVTGGGTTTNIVMQVRRNGVTVPSSFVATNALSSSKQYTLRAMVTFAVGDLLTFACGKTLISVGTTLISLNVFTIKYIS